MGRLRVSYTDGRTEELEYDGLMLPDSYIKIILGDRVVGIHESMVARIVVSELDPEETRALLE